jgi:hypothetical protein
MQMSEMQHLADDLRFVRGAVETHRQRRYSPLVAIIWAAYTLIGYTLIDLAPAASGIFFLVGGVGGGVATAAIYRRADLRNGMIDRAQGRQQFLAWFGAFCLIVAASVALQVIYPSLRGTPGGQIIVVMVGLMYYLTGAYGPPALRYMLWGGPVVMAGGICVGLLHHYGWTALGVLIAAIILLPALRPAPDAAHTRDPVQP